MSLLSHDRAWVGIQVLPLLRKLSQMKACLSLSFLICKVRVIPTAVAPRSYGGCLAHGQPSRNVYPNPTHRVQSGECFPASVSLMRPEEVGGPLQLMF